MSHILDRFCRPPRVPPPASGVCGAGRYATAHYALRLVGIPTVLSQWFTLTLGRMNQLQTGGMDTYRTRRHLCDHHVMHHNISTNTYVMALETSIFPAAVKVHQQIGKIMPALSMLRKR